MRARGEAGGGESHRVQRGRGAVVRRWRDGDGRRRADRHDGGPTQRRRRSDGEGNRRRMMRGSFPREESKRRSPETANHGGDGARRRVAAMVDGERIGLGLEGNGAGAGS